ncbi:hypothetical protein EDD21DRAFT_389222 [Dissophora ornata]|nr:hypothetical protein EDD21DRAFT_389222 [Dissophora ornata]
MAGRPSLMFTAPLRNLLRARSQPYAPTTTTATAAARFSLITRSYLSTSETRGSSTTATAEQGEEQGQGQDSPSSPLPLYSFHDISERDMLLSEMRHHRVSWTMISKRLNMSLAEACYTYIASTSKALHHGWTPRMTAQDIEYHIKRSDWRP